MIEIGKYNNLVVLKNSSVGLFLGDGKEEILLPKRYAPESILAGERIKVFVYLDNDNRLIATTIKPFAVVEEFAFLNVKEMNNHGAFLNWGIDRDLFVPYSEQTGDPMPGDKRLVYIFIDRESGRIAASMKWEGFMDENTMNLVIGQEVKLLIAQQTDFGFKAIINNQFEGLIYHNEIFQPLHEGDVKQGFIKFIREDGKVDLSLQKQGYAHVIDEKQNILKLLEVKNGVLEIGDKSSPELIYSQLKISKKAFKKAIGGLYKDKKITISDFQINLIEAKRKK